ncbi:MAG: alpha-amylase family glycosyl hydrolase [Planctomycetota bacterium]
MTRTTRQSSQHLVVAAAILAACCAALTGAKPSRAADVSAEPFLQIFEAQWDTIDERMPDIFAAGYGRLWLPPPARADSGSLSVGYDVYDRFDLGQPRNETLYGTETGLKNLVSNAHTAGIKVNTDFIANHNGFSDKSTFDNFGTPNDPSDDVTFLEAGGYPGFVLTLPNVPDGDFHDIALFQDQLTERLAGLIDIDQSQNHQFIRNPVDPNNPANIPAGTTGIFGRPPANVPDPNNARFYQDQDLGGTVVFDTKTNQNVTLYDFNTTTPLAGDAVTDNATGLIMRNARWMIQEIGVDGFRFDAARHFERYVLEFLDQSSFRSKQSTLLDGSPDHPFSFSETGGDSDAFVASFIRKDIDNNNLGQIGGNRDSLDFNLFFSIRDNLSDNGLANDWRNIKNRSVDSQDDGLANNGSQGVAFAQSHDDGPAHLNNVANAYLAMRPGNWNVYLNADQFDHPLRDFPKPGREDALGGLYGEVMTTLVSIRNTHGRGNYMDRTPGADEKELLIYERENSALVVLNNRLDAGFDARTVQTGFAPGTPLIELTGNAADATVDPDDDIPELLVVKADGTVDLRSVRNLSPGVDGVEHGNGYLIYGVAGPQGTMRLTDSSGTDFTKVLGGSTPMAGDGGVDGPSDNVINGRTRLTDITVVHDDTFKLRIETDAVNLLGSIRDRHADGDFGQFRIDDGRDKDGNVIADNVTPGDVAYGFTNFTDVNTPGFFEANGEGLYEQTIDTTQLSEGRHYLTGRVYRHRNPNTTTDNDPTTAGDGGPAVFTEFREVIYVDLLPPEAEVVSFEPFASDPNNPDERDLIVRSTDGTADNMHFFLNQGAAKTDAELLQMALNGQGDAGEYDSDSWISGFFGVTSGNHTVSVVTFEPTFDGINGFNVQRFAGLSATTNIGAGLGDLDADGVFEVADLFGVNSFEQVLYSENMEFNAAADVNADGLVDNLDLFGLGDELIAGGASLAVLDEYSDVLRRRGDVNQDGVTDGDDVVHLHANFGGSGWLEDLNVDGIVDILDVATLITELADTSFADFDLDGIVSGSDYLAWQRGFGISPAATFNQGDADLGGAVNGADLATWLSLFGGGNVGAAAVPEPNTAVLALTTLSVVFARRRNWARKNTNFSNQQSFV